MANNSTFYKAMYVIYATIIYSVAIWSNIFVS